MDIHTSGMKYKMWFSQFCVFGSAGRNRFSKLVEAHWGLVWISVWLIEGTFREPIMHHSLNSVDDSSVRVSKSVSDAEPYLKVLYSKVVWEHSFLPWVREKQSLWIGVHNNRVRCRASLAALALQVGIVPPLLFFGSLQCVVQLAEVSGTLLGVLWRNRCINVWVVKGVNLAGMDMVWIRIRTVTNVRRCTRTLPWCGTW